MEHGECLELHVGCVVVAHGGSQLRSQMPLARVSSGISAWAKAVLLGCAGVCALLCRYWCDKVGSRGAIQGPKEVARGVACIAGHFGCLG